MTRAIKDYSRGWNDGLYIGWLLGTLITSLCFLAVWVAGWVK
jgi:hypothetical protein